MDLDRLIDDHEKQIEKLTDENTAFSNEITTLKEKLTLKPKIIGNIDVNAHSNNLAK